MTSEIYDIDLEQEVLGAVLFEATMTEAFGRTPETVKHLTPDIFFDPLHQRIACCILDLSGVAPPTIARVADAMPEGDEGFEQVGGKQYLKSLAVACHHSPRYGGGVWIAIDILEELADKRAADCRT